MSVVQPLDFDGDGVLDIVYFEDDDDGDVDRDGRLKIAKRTGDRPDLMTGAGIRSDGERVEFDYTTLADRDVANAVHGRASSRRCARQLAAALCPGTAEACRRRRTDGRRSPQLRGRQDRRARTRMAGFRQAHGARHGTGTALSVEYDNTTREGGADGSSVDLSVRHASEDGHDHGPRHALLARPPARGHQRARSATAHRWRLRGGAAPCD